MVNLRSWPPGVYTLLHRFVPTVSQSPVLLSPTACAQQTLPRVCVLVPSAQPRAVSAHPISETSLRLMNAPHPVTHISRVRTTGWWFVVALSPTCVSVWPLGYTSWSVISPGGHRVLSSGTPVSS